MIIRADWREKIREVLSSRQRQVIFKEGYRKAAVLLPIYENKGEQYVVLTRRTHGVMYHKGQISFPGGAYDKGDGELKATAIREAFEEIGVHPEEVEILGNLDDQVTYTSNFVITPFVGAIPYPVKFRVSHREVEELIEAPISALLVPCAWVWETTDENGKSYPWGHFIYEHHKITGITARILKQLIDLVCV